MPDMVQSNTDRRRKGGGKICNKNDKDEEIYDRGDTGMCPQAFYG